MAVTVPTQVLSDRCVTTVLCLPRLDGAAIIGHDRLDELFVVQVVVRSHALQLLDSSYRFASEHLSVSGNANLTRPLRRWDAPIERSDELTERGLNAAPRGSAAEPFLGHWDTLTLRCSAGKVL